MATLPRFKWIPMLLEAIQEAKQRTNWAANSAPGPAQLPGKAGGIAAPARNATPGGAATGANTRPPARTAPASRPVKRLPTPSTRSLPSANPEASLAPPRGRKGVPARFVRTQQASGPYYRSLMRELRETKDRLRQLEVIHQKLNQIHQELAVRLSELAERVDKQQAQSHSRTRPGPPGSNTGIPPYAGG